MKLGTIAVAALLVACGKSEAKDPPQAKPEAKPAAKPEPAGLKLLPMKRAAGPLILSAKVPEGWNETVGDPSTFGFSDPAPDVALRSAVILRAGCVGPCDGATQTLEAALTWQVAQHQAAGFEDVQVTEQRALPDGGFEAALTMKDHGAEIFQYVRQIDGAGWATPATCVSIANGAMAAHHAELRTACEAFTATLANP